MKKRIITLLLTIIIGLSISACSSTSVQNVNDGKQQVSMFVVIENTYDWIVVYHKETKVMYVVSDGDYNHGTFTLLVDENGDPLLYKE